MWNVKCHTYLKYRASRLGEGRYQDERDEESCCSGKVLCKDVHGRAWIVDDL